MTVREIYESVLVEINKENAPTFTIEEFNYLLNKAVLAFVNEKYNFYAANQQLSDDLRVLLKTSRHNVADKLFNKTRAIVLKQDGIDKTVVTSASDFKEGDRCANSASGLPLVTINSISVGTDVDYPNNPVLHTSGGIFSVGDVLYVETPELTVTDAYGSTEGFSNDQYIEFDLATADYLHILSCRVIEAGSKYSYTAGGTKTTYLTFPAKRLTFDMLNFIENNAYLRPARNRPYFQVFDNKNNFGVVKYSTDDPNSREYQNQPRIKIYIGRDNKVLKPYEVQVDYIKMPEYVLLDDIDLFSAGEDSSQVLEFPDYLKNEIVKRVSIYLLEKTGDPRIQTQPAVNQEMPTVPMNMQQQQQVQGATPAQQQQAQQ